ncbi:MAG: glycosyltransferase family 39 protein, partial [Acidobacteria bacterium]|nr:glycosyltransferase family 39 protein [Acidobacteriota bacterium]
MNTPRARAVLLIAFSVVYWASTLFIAHARLLWNDELFTLYISKLPTFSAVWGALSTGAEQTPPLFYVITRAFLSVFGMSSIALRLPETIGYWVMSLCVFFVVARRSGNLHAFVAMLFPLVTSAYFYAYEARPYGLLLGFAGLSLLAWQHLAENDRRRVWLVVLALSLAASVAVHYYGIFTVVPLAVGELTRSITRRRVDVVVWVAFAFSVLPLAFVLPLIRAGMSHAGVFWSPALWNSIPEFYRSVLSPSAAVVTGTIAGTALVLGFRWSSGAESRHDAPQYEVAAALAFV